MPRAMWMCRAAQVVIVPRVGRDDRVVVEQLIDVPRHDLRLERRIVPRLAGSHQLPPFLHPLLGLLQERPVLLAAVSRGSSAWSVALASPTRPTSTG